MADLGFIKLSPRAKDITGERYGKLLVLGPVGRDSGRRPLWRAVCECGNEIVDRAFNLSRNVSCGCHRSARMEGMRLTHGENRRSIGRTPTYYSWGSMIARCHDPKHDNYAYYGARGITVCEKWRKSFEAFRADMGDRPDGMSIDRKDVNGNYEPNNCRWATPKEQAQNRRPRAR